MSLFPFLSVSLYFFTLCNIKIEDKNVHLKVTPVKNTHLPKVGIPTRDMKDVSSAVSQVPQSEEKQTISCPISTCNSALWWLQQMSAHKSDTGMNGWRDAFHSCFYWSCNKETKSCLLIRENVDDFLWSQRCLRKDLMHEMRERKLKVNIIATQTDQKLSRAHAEQTIWI